MVADSVIIIIKKMATDERAELTFAYFRKHHRLAEGEDGIEQRMAIADERRALAERRERRERGERSENRERGQLLR